MGVNIWSILSCGVAAMILGGLWYGPFFGNLWMQGMGINPSDEATKAQMKKAASPAYIQMFIGSLLMAWVLSTVLWAFSLASPEITGFSAGIQGGFYTWLGFILPVKYSDKLWGGKKFKFVAIDLAYYLVLLMVMGLIIVSM